MGAVTLTLALPVTPSLVAVIVADPTESAVTRPVVVTDATVAALDAQLIVRPVKTFPEASLSVAAN